MNSVHYLANEKKYRQIIFPAISAVPALIIVGIDAILAVYSDGHTTLSFCLIIGNILSLLLFWRHPEQGSAGVFLFSYLLLGLPAEYTGHTAAVLLVSYPMVYLIVHGRWLTFFLSVLFYGFMVALGTMQPVGSSIIFNLAFLLLLVLPAGAFIRFFFLQHANDKAEVAQIQRRTMDHLSMAVHDTVLTTLTRDLLRIRELAASTDDASVYTELMSIEEGLRATSRSLRQVFNSTESPDVQPESFNVLHADINLLARTSSHPLHLENEVSDLEELLTRDQYRFLLLMLREGVVNATKYAPRHSEISLDISQSAEGIEASVVSAMPENISADRYCF